MPTIILNYDSFKGISDDVSDARVYGGIHFRTDQEAQGLQVANWVLKNSSVREVIRN